MTKSELFAFYVELDDAGKVSFLPACSFNLTVAMREFYREGYDSELRAKSLLGANELQHQLS